MTRVKICGIRRPEDALAVSRSGADALGLVFYPPSPRSVEIPVAEEISATIGPFLTTVALFVNPSEDDVERVLSRVKPHLLQFHGDETADFCEQFRRPYMKAIRVKEDTDIDGESAPFSSAAGIIFDAWSEDLYGGTGKTFDWNKIRDFRRLPVILAGGLRPDNVAEAVKRTRPYGVDVSGGVEISPGVKDPEKIADFVNLARQAS